MVLEQIPDLLAPWATKAKQTQLDPRKEAFVQEYGPYAKRWGAHLGVAPEVLLAMGASESNWGAAGSIFGIKGPGPGGKQQTYDTWEAGPNGERIPQKASFAVYDSPDEAFSHFAQLMQSERYAPALNYVKATGDSAGFLRQINDAGYATDRNWAGNIVAIANSLGDGNFPDAPPPGPGQAVDSSAFSPQVPGQRLPVEEQGIRGKVARLVVQNRLDAEQAQKAAVDEEARAKLETSLGRSMLDIPTERVNSQIKPPGTGDEGLAAPDYGSQNAGDVPYAAGQGEPGTTLQPGEAAGRVGSIFSVAGTQRAQAESKARLAAAAERVGGGGFGGALDKTGLGSVVQAGAGAVGGALSDVKFGMPELRVGAGGGVQSVNPGQSLPAAVLLGQGQGIPGAEAAKNYLEDKFSSAAKPYDFTRAAGGIGTPGGGQPLSDEGLIQKGATQVPGAVIPTTVGQAVFNVALGAGPIEKLTGLPLDNLLRGIAERGAQAGAKRAAQKTLEDIARGSERAAPDLVGTVASASSSGINRAKLGNNAKEARYGQIVRDATQQKLGSAGTASVEMGLVKTGNTWADYGDAVERLSPEKAPWLVEPASSAVEQGSKAVKPDGSIDYDVLRKEVRQSVENVNAERAGQGTRAQMEAASQRARPAIGGENSMLGKSGEQLPPVNRNPVQPEDIAFGDRGAQSVERMKAVGQSRDSRLPLEQRRLHILTDDALQTQLRETSDQLATEADPGNQLKLKRMQDQLVAEARSRPTTQWMVGPSAGEGPARPVTTLAGPRSNSVEEAQQTFQSEAQRALDLGDQAKSSRRAGIAQQAQQGLRKVRDAIIGEPELPGATAQRRAHVPQWAESVTSKAKKVGVAAEGVLRGAPPGIETTDDLVKLERHVEEMAYEGEGGRFWHNEGSHAMLSAAHGDVETATRLAWIAAMGSPQTPVETQGSQILKAWGQYINGEPIAVHSATQNARMKKIFDLSADEFDKYVAGLMEGELTAAQRRAAIAAGESVDRGRKTANFFLDHLDIIDPERAAKIRQMSGRSGITVDMHMMRAFGYNSDAPTPDQYDFIEKTTQRLAQKLGWDDRQAQATIFTSDIIRDPNRKISVEQAALNYEGALKKNQAVIPFETAPGNGSPASSKIPNYSSWDLPSQIEYHADAQRALLDDQGNDAIEKALGLLGGGTREQPGIYEGKLNLGAASDVYVHRNMYNKIEEAAALKGYVLQQTAVPWVRPVYDLKVGAHNGLVLDLGRGITPDEALALNANLGRDFVVMTGNDNDVFVFKIMNDTDFAGREADAGSDAYKAMFEENKGARQKILDTMDQVWPEDLEVRHTSMATEGGYPENDWTVNPNGEAYLAAAPSAQSPDVRQVVNEARSKFQAVVDRHAERHATDPLPGTRDARFDYSSLEPVTGLVARQRDITRAKGTAWVDPDGQIWVIKGKPGTPGEHVDAIAGGREQGTAASFNEVMPDGWTRVQSTKNPDSATREINIQSVGADNVRKGAEAVLDTLPESAYKTTNLVLGQGEPITDYWMGTADEWLKQGKPVSQGDPFGRTLRAPGPAAVPGSPVPSGRAEAGAIPRDLWAPTGPGSIPSLADPFGKPTQAEIDAVHEALLTEANRLDQTGVGESATRSAIGDLATLAKRLGDPGSEIRRQLQQGNIIPAITGGGNQQQGQQPPLGNIAQGAAKSQAANLKAAIEAVDDKAKKGVGARIGSELAGVFGLPRTWVLGGDTNAARSLTILASHPGEGIAAAGKGLQANVGSYMSPELADRAQNWVDTHPLHDFLTNKTYFPDGGWRSGPLRINKFGPGVEAAERVPEYSGMNASTVSKIGEMLPGVARSERADAVGRNVAGMDWAARRYAYMAQKYDMSTMEGLSKFISEMRSTVDWANHMRGYSGSKVASVLGPLNALTSPQQMVSRLQLMVDPIIFAARGDTEAAKYAGANLLGFLAEQGSFLTAMKLASQGPAKGLWSVNLNPTSTDFGQVKVGNTRIDTLAGLGPAFKLFARVGSAISDSTLGTDLAPNDQAEVSDLLTKWFENKENPSTKLLTDYLFHHKTPDGQSAQNILLPSLIGGTLDVLQNEQGSRRLALAPLVTALQFGGIGTTTYKSADDVKREATDQVAPGKKYSELSDIEKLPVLAALPADAPKNAITPERDKFNADKKAAGYKDKPKDVAETEDQTKERNANNAEVWRKNPELDARKWFFSDSKTDPNGGALQTKAAVDKVLSLNLPPEREVHYQGADRNLATPEGRKLWADSGQRIETFYSDSFLNKNKALLDYNTNERFGKSYGELKDYNKKAVASSLRTETVDNTPSLDALHAYLGYGGNSNRKVYLLHSQAALDEVKKLEAKYGKGPAKDGYKWALSADAK